MVIGDIRGDLKVFDDSKTLIRTVNAHYDGVLSIKYLSNGLLASASKDTTVKIWDTTTWSLVTNYTGHSLYVYTLEYLGDYKIASGSRDNTIQIWNVLTGALIKTLKDYIPYPNQDYSALCLKLLPNGLLAYGRYGYGYLATNNITTNTQVSNYIDNYGGGVNTYIFDLKLVNDKVLASAGGFANTVKLWNLTTGSLIRTLEGHTSMVNVLLLISPTVLASGSTDLTIKLWNITTGSLIRTITGAINDTNSCYSTPFCVHHLDLFSSDMLVTVSFDKTIKFVQISTGQVVQTMNTDLQVTALATCQISQGEICIAYKGWARKAAQKN